MNCAHHYPRCGAALITAVLFTVSAVSQAADPRPGTSDPQRKFTGVPQQQAPVRRDQDLNNPSSRPAPTAAPRTMPPPVQSASMPVATPPLKFIGAGTEASTQKVPITTGKLIFVGADSTPSAQSQPVSTGMLRFIGTGN